MKNFTQADIDRSGNLPRLSIDTDTDREYRPLWWHEKGLIETSSGYGRKLTTAYMLQFNGRARRIYCTCFSNCGTCWITVDGERVIVW